MDVGAANATDDLRSRVAAVPFWWHTMDLGKGVVTPGHHDPAPRLARSQFPASLAGKTVLDIGAWDGFFSFEAERRGAELVLAVDTWDPTRGGDAPTGFDIARDALRSRVESVRLGVEELSPQRVGVFDVVLFLNVLYHLEDPFTALKRVRSVTRELLILETATDMHFARRPALAFYPGGELRGDRSNWFAPNLPALTAMLHAAGFRDVRVVWSLGFPQRVYRALRDRRTRSSPIWAGISQGRAVVHAVP